MPCASTLCGRYIGTVEIPFILILIAEGICMQRGKDSVTIWPEVIDKWQFGRVFTPQSQDVVFPSNHLAKNEHDRDCRKTNQQEKWVSSLHHIKAFFVTQHLLKKFLKIK